MSDTREASPDVALPRKASPKKPSLPAEAVTGGDASPESSCTGTPMARSPSRARIMATARTVKKPQNLAALGVFGVFVARMVWHQVQERQMVGDLMAAFDVGKDEHLSFKELASLLRENGLDFNQEQVGRLFGRIDDEKDGFDQLELEHVLSMVDQLPTISERVHTAVTARNAWAMDIFFIMLAATGLYYMMYQSDRIEKRWLSSSFRNAVQFQRMQYRCSKLDKELSSLSEERSEIEKAIEVIEASSSPDLDQKQLEIGRLSERLQEVSQRQCKATNKLEGEVEKWQRAANERMNEASQVRTKLKSMMSCIKGLEAFSGSGLKKYDEHGAQQGFCHISKLGFCMDTITFGTIEDGKLLIFETSARNKIGEGRDCAYRCKEVESGEEFALKMYTMSNLHQRRSIFHDLFAYRSQVGKHPRIVSYERVIESENQIFVLMELLKGMDLFEVVCCRQLTENQAKRLFRHLLEGVQHLHNSEVIHCDIKPENAFVVGNLDDESASLKLIDFGCSCFKRFEESEVDLRACVVHDGYIPPEHAASPSLKPAVATDMWRLGCTLFVMLVRRPPFHPHAQEDRLKGNFGRTPEYNVLSDEVKDLIEKLLTSDPAKRPTTAEVLAHPWMK